MTTADFMASSSDDVGPNPKEPPHMDLVRMAVEPVPWSIWHGVARFAPFGVAAAAIGWCVEWGLGSRVAISWLTQSATGWPPLGGVVFVIAVAILFGAGHGYVRRLSARKMIMGRVGVPGSAVDLVRLRPVWWACWIAEFVLILTLLTVLLALALIGDWFSGGRGVSASPKWSELSFLIGWIALMAAGGATAETLYGLIKTHSKKFKHALMSLWMVWLGVSIIVGLLTGSVCLLYLGVLAWAFDAVTTASGLGSTLALSTAVGLLILIAPFSYTFGKWTWDDRKDWLNPPMPFPRGQLPEQDDFRNWDLERETHTFGGDADDRPFYLWRESADDRLGLSRPRYCRLWPVDGELCFVFFNPSENVRPSGGLTVFFIVAAVIATTILGAYVLTPWTPAPYASNMKPPVFGMIIAAALFAVLLGAIAGIVWHVLRTLLRWLTDRFAGDGRIYSHPLRLLSGFNMEHAGQLGATIAGETAKTGHGLTAVFEDGSMIILTGNAWNYESIVEKHRDLTTLFRLHRDDIVANWDAAQKELAETKSRSAPASQQRPAVAEAAPPAQGGVPDSL